jgi:hypothetical protein
MTPFEQKLKDYREGRVALPKVYAEGGEVDPMGYQLAVTRFQLGLYASGMLPHRGFKITLLKKFFGLKGTDRKALVTQFDAIVEAYKRGDIGE